MSNPKELQGARRRAAVAANEAALIESLPRRVGQRVRWKVNGLEWERRGDDEWAPIHEYHHDVGIYDSRHVATVAGRASNELRPQWSKVPDSTLNHNP